jgi:hypothetical protein
VLTIQNESIKHNPTHIDFPKFSNIIPDAIPIKTPIKEGLYLSIIQSYFTIFGIKYSFSQISHLTIPVAILHRGFSKGSPQ